MWLVTIAGNAAAAAQVTGNGAIDGSVNFNGNANLGSSSASSSTSLTVTGNFNVNTGAVLQVEYLNYWPKYKEL